MKITKTELKSIIQEVVEEDSRERESRERAPIARALREYTGRKDIRRMIKDVTGYYPESNEEEAEDVYLNYDDLLEVRIAIGLD